MKVLGEVDTTASSETTLSPMNRLTTSARRTFAVQADTETEDEFGFLEELVVSRDARFVLGHQNDRGLVAYTRSVKLIDAAAKLWHVEMGYNTRVQVITEVSAIPGNRETSEEGKEDQDELESTSIDWSWGSEIIQEVLTHDAVTTIPPGGAGKPRPISNSAGEPLFPSTPRPIAVLDVKKYKRTSAKNEIRNYVSKVNANMFWGHPRGCALMTGISETREIRNDENFFLVTYTIKFKFKVAGGNLQSDSWMLELLDHGTYFLDNPENHGKTANFLPKPKVHFGAAGNARTTGNLDGQGGPLAPGLPPVYLPFHSFPYADFGTLNIGGGAGL